VVARFLPGFAPWLLAALALSCAKQPEVCALTAADLSLAEHTELNSAAMSEECLQVQDIEQCRLWREAEQRWRAKWNSWKGCADQ
jgi:hypothetical protein